MFFEPWKPSSRRHGSLSSLTMAHGILIDFTTDQVFTLVSCTWRLNMLDLKNDGQILGFEMHIQCESKIPIKFSGIFPQMLGNFLTKIYTPVTRSYLRSIANFYLIICNFDEVVPY